MLQSTQGIGKKKKKLCHLCKRIKARGCRMKKKKDFFFFLFPICKTESISNFVVTKV